MALYSVVRFDESTTRLVFNWSAFSYLLDEDVLNKLDRSLIDVRSTGSYLPERRRAGTCVGTVTKPTKYDTICEKSGSGPSITTCTAPGMIKSGFVCKCRSRGGF